MLQSGQALDLGEITQHIRQFAADRGWEKFHNPKNIATSLMIESAELADIFLWMTEAESVRVLDDEGKRAKLEDEVGDVLHNLIRLCDLLGLDVNACFWKKMKKTEQQYPIERFKDKRGKYSDT